MRWKKLPMHQARDRHMTASQFPADAHYVCIRSDLEASEILARTSEGRCASESSAAGPSEGEHRTPDQH